MTFTVETVTGDEVLRAEDLHSATVWARNALEDDPEVGTLLIWEEGVQRRTVTFGPDTDWQSVVVVLEPGEKVQPPTESIDSREIDGWYLGHDERAVAVREDGTLRMEPDEDPYDPADPKSSGYHDRMSAIWDDREKF